MKVSEIFYSFQGEGASLGIPSVFVRLAVCNLSCIWCDTSYTWAYSQQIINKVNDRAQKANLNLRPDIKVYDIERETFELRPKELIDSIKTKFGNVSNIIFTGGEPMLQQADLVETMSLLNTRFEVETAGTILPSENFLNKINQINCSPKLENSLNEKSSRYRPLVLKKINQHKNSWFKFVVTSEKDLDEISDIQKEIGIENKKIILMPEGVTNDELVKKSQWLIEICKNFNFRFSPRLHVYLWGNKRGV